MGGRRPSGSGDYKFLTSADHVVANVEGPLVDNTATLTQAN